MENKFEYLRIDGRDRLPSPWFSYPVLTEYETVAIYRNGRDYLDVLVGRQDGWWTAGVHMQVNSSVAGFGPGANGDSSPPVRTPFCGRSAGCSAMTICGAPHGRPFLTRLTISGNLNFSDHEACIECKGYPQQEV